MIRYCDIIFTETGRVLGVFWFDILSHVSWTTTLDRMNYHEFGIFRHRPPLSQADLA